MDTTAPDRDPFDDPLPDAPAPTPDPATVVVDVPANAGEPSVHEAEASGVILLGSSTLPATFEIDGATVALGEIVAAAFEHSGLTEDAWNELPEPDRDQKLLAELTARGHVADTTDATAGEPVTAEPAHQTPMAKPVADAPAYTVDTGDTPSPAQQAAPTEDPDPIEGVDENRHSPVLGAPIGVNPIIPQAADVEADARNARFGETLDPMAGAKHDGRVPMKHPDGGAADGFDAGADGAVLVPDEQVETMQQHGFVVVPEDK